MTRVLVVDVAAEYGGAISVLHSFIEEARKYPTIEWTFLVSKPTQDFDESDNVFFVSLPWVKKSWFHRLYFDFIYLNHKVDVHNYDGVVSLQNTLFLKNKNKTPSYLLIHHPVQFYNGFLNVLTIEGLKMFVRKHFIGLLIKLSSKRVDVIFAQTKWMQEHINNWVDGSRIRLIRMDNFMPDTFEWFDATKWNKGFIYPVHSGYAKNHIQIVRALIKMKKRKTELPKIMFTINVDENRTSKKLYNNVKQHNLPIEFIGKLDQSKLFNLLRSNVMLFPSKLETFGLPLLEARLLQTPIVSINLPYAEEILRGYERAYFFNTDDELINILDRLISTENIRFHDINQPYMTPYQKTMVQQIADSIQTEGINND